jgi:polysaccharide pyruvyl transferase WcaK-like protein
VSVRTRLRPARQALRRADDALFSVAGLPRTLHRSLGLATPGVTPVGYLGFAGRGNAGDDAILLGHERALAPLRLGLLPLEREGQTFSVLSRVRRRPLFRGVLVGGGTLLGRSPWRRRLERALAAQSGPLAITGAGVEDPEFIGTRSHTNRDELARWAEVLQGAAHLTVRGPRSAELLREVGIEAPVVSDTALLLAPDRVQVERVRPRLLGVNVADPEDQYAGTGSRASDACVAALRTLIASGWAVRLLAFDRKDLVVAEELRNALDGRAEVRRFAELDALLDAIAECDVLIGQRLHSVVLAAAVAVPALAIDYRPKCRDFQLSIGRGEWSVSTLDISAQRILDDVSALHEHREQHAQEIHTHVLRARETLVEGERRVKRLLETG